MPKVVRKLWESNRRSWKTRTQKLDKWHQRAKTHKGRPMENGSLKNTKIWTTKFGIRSYLLIWERGEDGKEDFSGPYIIKRITRKVVMLPDSKRQVLKNKYSITHLKPYRRTNPKDTEPAPPSRPSVIQFAFGHQVIFQKQNISALLESSCLWM